MMLMQENIFGQRKLDTRSTKAKTVVEIAKLAKGVKTIAIADLRNLPDRQLQSMRKRLRGKATIVVAKNTLIERGLKEAKVATELVPQMNGPAAVIFTDMDPFKLSKLIRQGRGKAAAKPGQIAPFDIIVPAGETALPPGPVLTELKQAGVQAAIQGGKVVISKDSTVAKAGEKISLSAAKALQKLGVEPFEVGVSLAAAWEKGTIYSGIVLDIDEKVFMGKLSLATMSALNLAVGAAYPTKMSIRLLIGKAVRESKAVAVKANIYDKDNIGTILAKAQAQADVLGPDVKAN